MDNKQITKAAPVVLYDSQWWLDYESAAATVESYCDCNESAAPAYNSAEWWEIINTESDWMAEDFRDNLKWSKFGQRPAVVCGELGTWRGRFGIAPKYFRTLEEAVLACCQYDYHKITIDNGAIMVEDTHHDGTNHFCVRVIKLQYWDLADKMFFDCYGDISADDLPAEMFETIEEL